MTFTQGIIWIVSCVLALILAPFVWLAMLIIRVFHYQIEYYKKRKNTEVVWVKFKGYRKKGG